MITPPFLRGPKIGRNDPCSCGSGRKFKHCHGRAEYALPQFLKPEEAGQVLEEGKRRLAAHKTLELQRQRQQGLGRGIISVEFKGYRFVAVGSRLHYGKWRTFPDFLMNYIKTVVGPEWGTAEIAKPLAARHPIMQWYDRVCHLQAANVTAPGALISTPMTGAVSAYNRLAYNLYLIAHNGKNIEDRLLERLRSADGFQGAFFETQVAAWLIRAGLELEFEDESDRASTHCEFTATYGPTGDKFSVEAKSREIDEGNSSRAKVGRTLFKALEKKAHHRRLIFLDLNKPLHTREAVTMALDRAVRIVRQSEAMYKQEPPAYVCITNMNDQYALDTASIAVAAAFCGFKIHDFMGDSFPSLRAAARARERHWPMFQLFKSLEEHQAIPQTFDGELPSEVFSSDPPPRIKIGELFAVPGPNGVEVNAKVTTAIVVDGKAVCGLLNPLTGESWLGSFEMTKDELADYARHPDTYFGVLQQTNQRADTPMDLFDFFVRCYSRSSQEDLLKLLSDHPDHQALRQMAHKDLVETLAEAYTYSAFPQPGPSSGPRHVRPHGGAPKPP